MARVVLAASLASTMARVVRVSNMATVLLAERLDSKMERVELW